MDVGEFMAGRQTAKQVAGVILKNVQHKLGYARASLGSLSEAVEVFDPQRLCGVIESFAAKVKPVRDACLGHTAHVMTAVDGSAVKMLKSIAEAAFGNDKKGGSHSSWRLHTHFDAECHVPTRIEASPDSNSGHNDEKNRLRTALQPDHCYVIGSLVRSVHPLERDRRCGK